MATKIVFGLCNNAHLHQKMATKDLSLDYATWFAPVCER